MVINLSKESYLAWSQNKLDVLSRYGKIVDLHFPFINPRSDHEYLIKLAEEYRENILSELNEDSDNVILIDGELSTFTFQLISMLKNEDILVVEATEESKVGIREDKSTYYYKEFVMIREF